MTLLAALALMLAQYCDAPVFGVWDAPWAADAYPAGFVVEAGWCPARGPDDPRCVPAWDFLPFALLAGNVNYCDANLPYALDHENGRTWLAYRFLVRERRPFEYPTTEWRIPAIEWLGWLRYRGTVGPAAPPVVWADTDGAAGAVPWLLGCRARAAGCAALDPLGDGDAIFDHVWSLGGIQPLASQALYTLPGLRPYDDRVPTDRIWLMVRP